MGDKDEVEVKLDEKEGAVEAVVEKENPVDHDAVDEGVDCSEGVNDTLAVPDKVGLALKDPESESLLDPVLPNDGDAGTEKVEVAEMEVEMVGDIEALDDAVIDREGEEVNEGDKEWDTEGVKAVVSEENKDGDSDREDVADIVVKRDSEVVIDEVDA